MENDTVYLSRRQVIRAFKMRGLALQSAALEAMMNVLQRESSRSDEVLLAILDEIRERILSAPSYQQPIVTESLLAQVVADMSRDGRDVQEEALQLLDAYETPRLYFDTMRKQFTLIADEEKRSFFGVAADKVCQQKTRVTTGSLQRRSSQNRCSFPLSRYFRSICLRIDSPLSSSEFFDRISFVLSLTRLTVVKWMMDATSPTSLLLSRACWVERV